MKQAFSILTAVLIVLAFLVSCGGSEGSNNGEPSNSDWDNSGENNSDGSEYGGSSDPEEESGSSWHNDDEDLKFQILDMNGNPISYLEIPEGSEVPGFQLYNGTGKEIAWFIDGSACYCESDRWDIVHFVKFIDPDSGVLAPGTSAPVVLTIDPLVYSYEVKNSTLSISADRSYNLELRFPKKETPECSPENSALCKDSSSGLMWSEKGDPSLFNNWHVWEFAVDYCDSLYEGGSFDWHLPTIDELRTLIQNCPETESGGSCPVSETHGNLYKQYAEQCTGCGAGGFSKFGDKDNLWSSSSVVDDSDYAWYLSFSKAAVATGHKEYDYFDLDEETPPMSVRCVSTAR